MVFEERLFLLIDDLFRREAYKRMQPLYVYRTISRDTIGITTKDVERYEDERKGRGR